LNLDNAQNDKFSKEEKEALESQINNILEQIKSLIN